MAGTGLRGWTNQKPNPVSTVDAVLQMAAISGLDSPEHLARLRTLADRVGAMLFGLIRREQARA